MNDKIHYRKTTTNRAGKLFHTNHWTRGKFVGWTHKTGLLRVNHAIIRLTTSDLLIPIYDLLLADKQRLLTIKQLPREDTP